MSDNSKMIRFIDSDYKELFQVPDGGSIKITYPPGDGRGTITRQCKFLDEYHTRVGNETYHICQFAEIMERLGARYEPEVQLRDAELTPFTPGDEKFYTYNREESNTCVGHISGDFGNSGDRFHNSWRNHKTRSEKDWSDTTPEFQTELHSAVYALRRDLLKDYDSMASYCENHPEALIDSGENYKRYGFKLETDTRQYYTQCFFGESMRDARFIIYAYEDPAPELQQARLWEVIPGTAEDSKMFYRNDAESSLSMGYLRGDFGKSGNEFHHNWFDSDGGKNTPEFKSEFQVIMNGLRKDVLKDLKSSQDFCYKHPEAQLPGDIHRYGFKVETKNRQYFVRCTVISNDYFYVFAYDKVAAREQGRPAGDKTSALKQYVEQHSKVESFAKESVREWYAAAFPDDSELAKNIHPDLTFGDVLRSPQKGDCAKDSVVRERVFAEMESQTQLPYDVFYYGWLDEIDSISEIAEKRFSGEQRLAIHDFVLDHTDIFVDPADRQDTHVQNAEIQDKDKPSVLKQIRDAEKAPKKPRKPKEKTADKKKDGVEL